jgi:hypothetical protein
MSAMYCTELYICGLINLNQRYKNPGRHFAMAVEF